MEVRELLNIINEQNPSVTSDDFTATDELELVLKQLTTFPAEIGDLDGLRWLRLDANQLTELPPEIGNLTSLKEIVVHENHI